MSILLFLSLLYGLYRNICVQAVNLEATLQDRFILIELSATLIYMNHGKVCTQVTCQQ